jgi:iron complex outermembrane receptor protein
MLAMLFATSLLAQYSINGKVIDENKQALPGASIVLKGTATGTIAADDGTFTLYNLPNGIHTLSVSFIGYQEVQKTVNLKENVTLNIQLKSRNVLTEDVFVYATRAGNTTPMAVTNISGEEIAARNLGQDIPYLLNNSPSVVSTSDAGAGIGYTNFRVRGTDANRINVTINGIPLNDAESHGVFWVNMPDFSSSVENLQIQRGVGTSTHGAGAFGATINMQTSTLREEAYAEYNGAAGSFNTTKNTVQAGTGLLNDHFSFDMRLSKINTDGFIDRAYSDLKSYFVSGGYYAGNTIAKINVFSGNEKTYQAWNGVPLVRLNNDLEGMKRYEEHWLYTAQQTEEMINSDSRTYNIYTYENETDNYRQDHYQLLVSHRYSPGLSINLAGHYTRGIGYYEQFKPGHKLSNYGLEAIEIGETNISRADIVRQKWLDNHFYGAVFSAIYEKGNSDITLGGGWNHYIGHHYGNIIWAGYYGAINKDYEWYRNRGEKTDLNAYLKYNYRLSPALNLFADVQYRGIDFSIEDIDDDLRDITQEHRFDFINPKLGIFYRPSQQQKAWLSWAVANREPNRSNYTDADPEGPQPVAESLNDFEAGYTHSADNYSFSINGYYMLYDNQLILTGQINDVGAPIMTNVKESYRRGIELIAGAKITESIAWDANATFSQNRIMGFTEYVDDWDKGGQQAFEIGTSHIAFSPALIANNRFSFTPLENLSLSLVTQYVSEQLIDNSASPDRKLDAYLVNNFLASFKVKPTFAKEIEFQLMVNNLLNAEYETNAWVYSYILGGERFEMDGYYPQAGINFMLGMNIRF